MAMTLLLGHCADIELQEEDGQKPRHYMKDCRPRNEREEREVYGAGYRELEQMLVSTEGVVVGAVDN